MPDSQKFKFQYLTYQGETVTVGAEVSIGKYNESLHIDYKVANTRQEPLYRQKIELLIIAYTQINTNFEQVNTTYGQGWLVEMATSFIKDCILWYNISDPAFFNTDKEVILDMEKASTLGFLFQSDGVIRYRRNVNALSREGDLARWRILEHEYRKERVGEGAYPIRYETGLPEEIIRREMLSLNDLKLMEYTGRIDSARITAKGRVFYEQHVLPAHNQVFIIAPCIQNEIIDLFKRIVEEHGLKCIVQEEYEPRTETIREDMLNNIRSSKFIIADITGKGVEKGERFNINCVYEVGYAHAHKKRIVCCVNEDVCAKDEDGRPVLPFDIAGVPFTFWKSENLEELHKRVNERVDQIIDQFTRERWPES